LREAEAPGGSLQMIADGGHVLHDHAAIRKDLGVDAL
jgi:hypothetical protein